MYKWDIWEHGRPEASSGRKVAGTEGKGNEAGGMGEGSLSARIVPMKAGKPDLREPASRERGRQGRRKLVGNTGVHRDL